MGLSIYIWNRQQCFQLVEYLKKQNPGIRIVLGGPEVSFETDHSNDYYVIAGEGEQKWVEYLRYATRQEAPPVEVLDRWQTFGTDLPELHVPYIEEDLPHVQNRYAYIETSRGCPYLCSFCLSALDKTVRYFDDTEVRNQIEQLIDAGASKIKFVDRTFNLQPKRMRELMQWLTRFPGAEFHFEVVGDLLNDNMMSFLETVPRGLFQFEIGIQTVTEPVQDTIQRKQDNTKLFATIRRLIEQDRVHVHCDLIFGLPGETVPQMMESFREVFALRPHELQLGFLKFLPGAPVKQEIKRFEYRYLSTPPYGVIANRDVTAGQMMRLKKFNEVFDLFYNSKRFRFSLELLLERFASDDLFYKLADYLDKHTAFHSGLSLDNQYLHFADCFRLWDDPRALDALQLDYLYHQRTFHVPPFFRSRFPQNGSQKIKAWPGDRKTPVVPFHHEIAVTGMRARLTPASGPVYYAVAHPEDTAGYFHRPTLHRMDA